MDDYASMTREELEQRCASLEKAARLYEAGDPRLLLLDAAISRAQSAGAPQGAIVQLILTWTKSGCRLVEDHAPGGVKARASHD